MQRICEFLVFRDLPWNLLRSLVRTQKSKSEAVVKKEGKTRVRKTEVQKKAMSLNDRSFGILLRKLIVVLKG